MLSVKRGIQYILPYACVTFRNSTKYSFELSNKFKFDSVILQCSYCKFAGLADVPPDNIPEDRTKLIKWVEMCRYEGEYVPKILTEKHYDELLKKNFMQRRKYMYYLCKKEWAVEKDKKIKEKLKEQNKIASKERLKLNTTSHIQYGLWSNSMFAKTTERNIANFHEHRLARALMYETPIVMDLSFEEHMNGREISSLAEQIALSLAINKVDPDPLNLTFTNVDFESQHMLELKKRMPNIFQENYPMHMTSQDYMDLYPKENLIYLSPNAREMMTKIEPDAVYIIGGIVDLGRKEPLTFAKAKKQGIRMQKLPLDRYHIFKSSKDLALHVVTKILLDFKNTGNWKRALENIPKRLLFTADENVPSVWDLKRGERR